MAGMMFFMQVAGAMVTNRLRMAQRKPKTPSKPPRKRPY